MIRINLIPDLRQAKLRDQHRRQLTVSIGVLVAGVVIGVLIILEVVVQAQNLQISSYNNQISSRQSQLENIKGLPAALTAQQALNALPSLYQQRVYYTNLFGVLSSLAPSGLTINNIDETGLAAVQGIQITGTATSYTQVALFAQALMVGNTATEKVSDGASPFSSVTIDSITSGQNGQVSYELTVNINPEVLSNGN